MRHPPGGRPAAIHSAAHQRALGPQIMSGTHGSLHLRWEHWRPRVSNSSPAHMWLLFRALRGIDLHYHLPSSCCLHLPLRGLGTINQSAHRRPWTKPPPKTAWTWETYTCLFKGEIRNSYSSLWKYSLWTWEIKWQKSILKFLTQFSFSEKPQKESQLYML